MRPKPERSKKFPADLKKIGRQKIYAEIPGKYAIFPRFSYRKMQFMEN